MKPVHEKDFNYDDVYLLYNTTHGRITVSIGKYQGMCDDSPMYVDIVPWHLLLYHGNELTAEIHDGDTSREWSMQTSLVFKLSDDEILNNVVLPTI